MDENEFLGRILPLFPQDDGVAVGPGDDCAAVRQPGSDRLLLMAVDQLVSGVHYDPAITSPEAAGAKLLKRNVSDIAAMGGKPERAMVTVATGLKDFAWLERFYRGLADAAKQWDISVVGGDFASIPAAGLVAATLSIFGSVAAKDIRLRSAGRAGDYVYVTGCFGDSYHSGHHLSFTPRVQEGQFLAGRFARAMMDVSDGLLIDLKRLAAASGVSARLDGSRVPRRGTASLSQAWTGGEDYELVFSVPPELADELDAVWPFPGVPLTRIGLLQAGAAGRAFAPDGSELGAGGDGFDHFRGTVPA